MTEQNLKLDRIIQLLEEIAETQHAMHVRQQKLFKIYSWSAGLVWLVFGSIFALILYSTLVTYIIQRL